jgi:hypothetical protein
MSRRKAGPAIRKTRIPTTSRTGVLSLNEALDRVREPGLSSSLSVFFAELARAQRENDPEGIHEARRAIAEALEGPRPGPIDFPLSFALRSRKAKA